MAVLSDGEVSSPVTGGGIGGRNSAFVLACVAEDRREEDTVLSAGTDGIDGNSPAAGAVADGETLARAARCGPRSREIFSAAATPTIFSLGWATRSSQGPTGNNLRDLRILLAREKLSDKSVP